MDRRHLIAVTLNAPVEDVEDIDESYELEFLLKVRQPFFSYVVCRAEACAYDVNKVRIFFRTKVTLPEGFNYTITDDGQYMIYSSTCKVDDRWVSSLYSPTFVACKVDTEIKSCDVDTIVDYLTDVQGQYNQFNNNVAVDLTNLQTIVGDEFKNNLMVNKMVDRINSLIAEAPDE